MPFYFPYYNISAFGSTCCIYFTQINKLNVRQCLLRKSSLLGALSDEIRSSVENDFRVIPLLILTMRFVYINKLSHKF